MGKLKKTVAGILITSLLLQSLGSVSPVLAETVDIQFDDTHPLHAPEVVNNVIYEYDANGNLLNDGEKQLNGTRITNQLELPKAIKSSNSSMMPGAEESLRSLIWKVALMR